MAIFTSSTGEGRVYNSHAVWATSRGATIGLGSDASVVVQSDFDTNYNINRAFFPIDTSAIGAGATIISATLKLYRSDAVSAFFNADTTTIEIVTQTQASNTALVTDDYDQVAFVSKGSLALASTTNNAYTSEITISDLSVISLTGYTKLALITGKDLNNVIPGGKNTIGFQGRGDANPPTLTVLYSVGGLDLTSKYW